jgi:hypothetical protein
MFQVTVKEAEGFGEPPAIFPLAEFKEALTKKMRGVKFAGRGQNSVHVYYPHEKFTRGLISVHDGNYRVRSRFIRNERYSRDLSPEYYMQWSKNLNTAVKKAAAALQAWTVHELATVHTDPYTTGRGMLIQSVGQKAVTELKNLGLERDSIVLPMLRGMRDSIPDISVRTSVEDFFRYDKELNDLNGIGMSPTFVYVGKDHHGQQYLDTIHIHSVMYSMIQTDMQLVRHYERSPQEGYDELVGKISVLNMATVGDYVSGVGMKADEDMFYVC